MSSKYKKREPRKRDLEELKKIHKLPSTPRYDYQSTPYGQSGYGGSPYQPAPVRRVTTAAEPNMQRTRTGQEAHTRRTPLPVEDMSRRPQQRKQTKKKKKTHFFMGRILFFIVFIVAVIYLINIVVNTMQKPVISYQMVQRGIIDNSDVFSGLIVRSENVMSNKEEGNMYLIAAEGAKVKKDGEVYQVLDALETSAIEEDIQKVESDIAKVQNKRQDMSYYQNEIQAITNNIGVHLEEFYMLSKQGNLVQTQELKKQVEYEMVKRKNIHMQDNTTSLGALKSQKQELSALLSENQKIYKAPQSGWVSYYVDGFEQVFTVDKIDAVTEKDVKQKYANTSTTANQIIAVADPAYKLINDEKWYMVCFMPESWANRFVEGKTYDFMLTEDNNAEFSLKVEQNIPQEKQNKVVFTSREQLDLFSNKRTATFKSTQYIYEGLKIPKSAIAERNLMKIPKAYVVDHEDGLGVLKAAPGATEYVFSGLNVQFEDDKGYVHVLQNIGQKGMLQLGDTIVNPSQKDDVYTVSEVSMTQGVYVVNGRITKFKQLDILASNTEYVIVKSSSINGIKQFDQIVTNPKNVEEEQLLKDMDVKNTKN